MSIQLTIERQTQRFDSGIVEIGRAAENQFSLPNDSRLASLHVVLKSINNRWIIESRDGGPVRIGTGRPVQFAWLNSGDRVQLTEAGPELCFEVVATAPIDVAVETCPPTRRDASWVPKPMSIVAALVPMFLVATVWMLWPRASRIESRLADDLRPTVATQLPSSAVKMVGNDASASVVDPRELLILVGIGDLQNGNRPHVLGVGWLWDERTAVIPRVLGDFMESLIRELKNQGTVRQGCVIQGVALEFDRIQSPIECPEISILHLRKPAESPKSIRDLWQLASATDIQRRRGEGKKFRRLSFPLLPRSPEVERAQRESAADSEAAGYANSLSWKAYDPELTEFTERAIAEARLVFEQGRHYLNVADVTSRLERVSLLINEEQKIVGMSLPDASVIWTDSLQNALGSP